jgi:hypothetical protein
MKKLHTIATAIVISSQAFGETANIEIYSELLDYDVMFQQIDSDIVLQSFVITDTGLTSGKMRAEASMYVEGIYTTSSSEFNRWPVNDDSDANGIPDYFDLAKSYSASLTGSATYNLSGHGSYSANLSASVHRPVNQFYFNMHETMTIQSSTVAGVNPGQTLNISLGDLTLIHAKGTLNYDPDTETYSYSLNYFGTTGSANGSGTITGENENRVTFSMMSFPSMGYTALSSSQPALAQKTLTGALALDRVDSNTYQTQVTVQGIKYFIELTDDNDADNDGIPDLTDSSSQATDSSSQVSFEGWNYHAWPWTYSDADKDWIYYAHTDNGWAVWRNKDKKWYGFNASTSNWTAY